MINAWAIGRDPAAWERAEEGVPRRRVRRADRRARARQLAVSLRLGRADGAPQRRGDAARGRERGVRSLCPAQDAVDPRRQTMARINLTKWTGLRARGIKTEFHLH